MNMRPRILAATFGFVLAVVAQSALADKAGNQAEIRKAADATLQKFYKARPALQGEVQTAPGYAVFTSYGLTFLVGGAGGAGLAHDNKTKKDTYMNMAQASAGIQAGIAQSETLIVFKTEKGFQSFVDKGWEFGGAGAVSVGAGGKSAGGGEGDQLVNDARTYTYTKNGLEVGGALQGTKFWKDKDLN
jgi:lipid-binding SYLF domain-containing protein